MLNPKEAKEVKFETTAEEIMRAGSRALADMFAEIPSLILLKDELTHMVAATAARWCVDMQEKSNP